MKNTAMAALSELKEVEILAAGPLPDRGLNFTVADLREIAANTNALIQERLHNPPGKLGHDDAQAFARESGLPATGWAHNLRVKGDRLVADFAEVPRILYKAFKEKLYRKISSEVYFGFRHPKTQKPMGQVLRAVAFLGADIPQVKGLADFLDEEGQKVLSLAELDKLAEKHGAAGDAVFAFAEPDYEVDAVAVAAQLAEKDKDFGQDKTIDALCRHAVRVGAEACLGSPEFRQLSDPEGLVAWLQARAQGGATGTNKDASKETDMDPEKLKKLEEELASAKSKSAASEQEANSLKAQVTALSEQLAAQRKEKLNADIAAFVDTHKAVITPAIEPAFRALCESAGEGEVEVKLSEKPEKLSRVALTFKFAELVAKAKVVPLGEAPGAGKETPTAKGTAVKGASLHVELHEKAMGLIGENPKLSYKDAVNQALAADPSLSGK